MKPGMVPVSGTKPSWLEGILRIRDLQSENVSIFLQFLFFFLSELRESQGIKVPLRTASLSVGMKWRGKEHAPFVEAWGDQRRGGAKGSAREAPHRPSPGKRPAGQGGRRRGGPFLQG